LGKGIYNYMTSINTYYTDKEALHSFISHEKVQDSSSLLIQIFTASADESFISTLLSELNTLLPNAAMIGSTTDGEIMNGEVSSGKVVLSFTQFEHTTLKASIIEHQNDGYASGQYLAKELIEPDTKLMIAFIDGLHTNGEVFLGGITSVHDNIIVAGGLAGDNSTYNKTFVFTKEHIISCGAVAVSLSSKHLHVHRDYSFNWHPIGNELTITKAENNRVYTIDGKSAVDTYEHYLGENIAKRLPTIGIEFPLIINRNGSDTARAPIEKKEDGSLIMAGNLTTGEKVRIGYGDRKEIVKKSEKMIKSTSQKPSETIFVYSCSTRKYFIGQEVDSETLPLQTISPVSGFFTYGEFFTSNKKELFNQTATLVSLSESDTIHKVSPNNDIEKKDIDHVSMDALTRLINVSTLEVKQASDDNIDSYLDTYPAAVNGLTHLINITSEKIKESNKLNLELKERMELALSGNSAGVWEWNLIDNSVYCSPQWKEMLGYKDHELPNVLSIWKDRIHSDDTEVVMSDIRAGLDAKIVNIESIHRLKHKNGQWIWIMARGTIEYDKNAQALRMVGIHTDITNQKALQDKATERGKILDNSLNEIYIFDGQSHTFLYVNKEVEKNLGYSLDEIVSLTPLDIKPDITKDEFGHILKPLTEKKVDHVFFSTLHQRKNGTRYNVDVYIQSTVFESRHAYVAIILDVTKRKISETQLQKQKNILHHQAHHDVLTELPNRLLFTERLQKSIDRAKQHKTTLALFFIDLDMFKHINDSLGHDVGDSVLQTVAKRLEANIRKEDTLARLSGDEFTVIMDNINQIDDVVMLAEKLLKVLAEPMYINDHMLYVSASIGVSLYPQDATEVEDLLKYADTAMYKAKEEGRNNFKFYTSEMTQFALERMNMKTCLRQGIDNEEFVVYYQPQIDATTNTLVGLEALVRWEHPTKGLIKPDTFLLLAEETGMIIELDRWVMATAIKQVTQWYDEGLNPGVLALNLSIKQLEDNSLLAEILKNINTYGFKPEWLELEITEGHMMKKPKDTIAKLRQIDDLGIGISIDDFGTGYSSLSFLKQLPINRLKIDQSFIQDIADDEDDRVIIKAIIALGKSLKLDLIAEGVETSEQRDFLVENGCNNIQGHYYSNPIPAEEIQVKLVEHKEQSHV